MASKICPYTEDSKIEFIPPSMTSNTIIRNTGILNSPSIAFTADESDPKTTTTTKSQSQVFENLIDKNSKHWTSTSNPVIYNIDTNKFSDSDSDRGIFSSLLYNMSTQFNNNSTEKNKCSTNEMKNRRISETYCLFNNNKDFEANFEKRSKIVSQRRSSSSSLSSSSISPPPYNEFTQSQRQKFAAINSVNMSSMNDDIVAPIPYRFDLQRCKTPLSPVAPTDTIDSNKKILTINEQFHSPTNDNNNTVIQTNTLTSTLNSTDFDSFSKTVQKQNSVEFYIKNDNNIAGQSKGIIHFQKSSDETNQIEVHQSTDIETNENKSKVLNTFWNYDMEDKSTVKQLVKRKKKPYKELTLEEKVELIRLAECNSTLSQACIAERYAIAKSNVCRILQRRAEYLRAYESAGFAGSRKRKLRGEYCSTVRQSTPGSVSILKTTPFSNISTTELASTSESFSSIDSKSNKKCYTNQDSGEIRMQSIIATTSNNPKLDSESMRIHMYKQHQISRVFTCRCCNYAFIDKNTLQAHLQAKSEAKGTAKLQFNKLNSKNALTNISPNAFSNLSPTELSITTATPFNYCTSATNNNNNNIFKNKSIIEKNNIVIEEQKLNSDANYSAFSSVTLPIPASVSEDTAQKQQQQQQSIELLRALVASQNGEQQQQKIIDHKFSLDQNLLLDYRQHINNGNFMSTISGNHSQGYTTNLCLPSNFPSISAISPDESIIRNESEKLLNSLICNRLLANSETATQRPLVEAPQYELSNTNLDQTQVTTEFQSIWQTLIEAQKRVALANINPFFVDSKITTNERSALNAPLEQTNTKHCKNEDAQINEHTSAALNILDLSRHDTSNNEHKAINILVDSNNSNNADNKTHHESDEKHDNSSSSPSSLHTNTATSSSTISPVDLSSHHHHHHHHQDIDENTKNIKFQSKQYLNGEKIDIEDQLLTQNTTKASLLSHYNHLEACNISLQNELQKLSKCAEKMESEMERLKDQNNLLHYKLMECRDKAIFVAQFCQQKNEHNKVVDFISDILKITYVK